MAIGRNVGSARQMSLVLHLGATGSLTDGQLLERFTNRTGEAAELAFACLVERHGSLVLRICRSILRDEQRSLDAFQATFLVLVKKANSLVVTDSLAPWLHAVAYRVARNARASAARRQRHELRRAESASTVVAFEGNVERVETAAVLHQEIEALPERFRVPIVMCDLEGRSHEEVARSLGWPVGTVKSRQARGRDRLRGRLARRGLAPTLGSFAGLASPASGGSIPLGLIRQTAVISARFAVQPKAAGVGVASTPVLSLTKEFLMSLMLGKLKVASLVLVAATLAVAGTLEFASGAGGGGQPRVRRATAPARGPTRVVYEDPPAPREGKIYFGSGNGLVAVDPKTGVDSRILLQCKFRSRISPDGRLVAFEWEKAVWVRELEKIEEPRKLLDLDGARFGTPPVWSADGKALIISLGNKKDDKSNEPWEFKTVRINVDGTGKEELPIPHEDGVADWSPDNWLLTNSSRNAEIGWELYVMKPDGSDQRQITKGGNPFYTRFSPDGRRVLYTDGTTEERRGIWVVDRDGQNRRKVLSLPQLLQDSACWSPDGKRIAVLVFDRPNVGKPKGRLVLLEVDGDTRTEFPLEEDIEATDMPDWR